MWDWLSGLMSSGGAQSAANGVGGNSYGFTMPNGSAGATGTGGGMGGGAMNPQMLSGLAGVLGGGAASHPMAGGGGMAPRASQVQLNTMPIRDANTPAMRTALAKMVYGG